MRISQLENSVRIDFRDCHNAVSIAENDIAGMNHHTAALNRHIDGPRTRGTKQFDTGGSGKGGGACLNNPLRIPDGAIANNSDRSFQFEEVC